MSELNCAVIGDLLPLYEGELLCTDSQALVNQHLSACPACQKKLARMRSSLPLVQPDNRPFRAISRRILDWCKAAACLFLLAMTLLLEWIRTYQAVELAPEVDGLVYLSSFLFALVWGLLMICLCVLAYRLFRRGTESQVTRWLSWFLLIGAAALFCGGAGVTGYLYAANSTLSTAASHLSPVGFDTFFSIALAQRTVWVLPLVLPFCLALFCALKAWDYHKKGTSKKAILFLILAALCVLALWGCWVWWTYVP